MSRRVPVVVPTTSALAGVEPVQARALEALARLDVRDATPRQGNGTAAHDLLHRPPPPIALHGAVAAQFRRQFAAARATAVHLRLASDAVRAGYRLGSPYAEGTGAHYVDYTLVNRPFDPARPSMLLYDGNGAGAHLIAFSYWVASARAPSGFAGPNDVWHRHFGLCIVRGRAHTEDVAGAAQCRGGVFLDGRNLWMLHVWLVPSVVNPWGLFAAVDPLVRAAR